MRIEKKIIKRECEAKISSSKAMILTDYAGLSAEEMAEFRGNLRDAKAKYSIVKNSVFKLTAKEQGINCLDSYLNGPIGVAFIDNEDSVVSVAKVIKEFSAKHKDVFKIRGGIFNGEELNQDQIIEIASLPSKEIMVAQFIGCLNSVIVNFVGVLRAQVSSVVNVLDAIKQEKEKQ